MPGIYPDKISYFGEEITTKISMKTDGLGFKLERKCMRILPQDHPEQKYLDTIEKQSLYEIKWAEEDGYFVDHEGKSLSGMYNFIITCEESPRIICAKKLNHSFCANGKKVIAAGDFIFQNGSLISISNNSGHYRPNDEEMLPVIKALYRATKGNLISYRSHSAELPIEYPVLELLDAERVADVAPISPTEAINSITGQRELLVGYDDGLKSKVVNRSFNRNLNVAAMMRYQEIVDSHYGFFQESRAARSTDILPGLAPIEELPISSN